VVLGVTRCRLAVRAKSIGRALKIVGGSAPVTRPRWCSSWTPSRPSRPSFRTLPLWPVRLIRRLREPTVVWPELFGQFWDQVACP